jgi:hypothetical protein
VRPEGVEPPNLLIRSQALYPIELRAPSGLDRRPRTRPTNSNAEECPRQDSNLYAVSDTGPSNQPVYQFQHVGNSPLRIRENPG